MAKSLPKLALAAYATALAVIVLDQLSKWWILEKLMLPQTASVPFGPIRFSMVWNQGVSFGLLRADQDVARWTLAGFSAIVAIMLGRWALKVQRPLLIAAIGLVMGGAIGNLIDRVRFAAVVDFIDVTPLLSFFPWVFNIADSAINIGVVLLLIDTVMHERKTAAKAG
jgi:signal peptidase II